MEFISTKRGATKLCYDGFAYTKKKSSKTTITWECAQLSNIFSFSDEIMPTIREFCKLILINQSVLNESRPTS